MNIGTVVRAATVMAVMVGFSPNAAAVQTSARIGTWQVLGAARTLPTLYHPMGLTVGSKGNVYVADSGNFRVVEIGPHGRPLAHFGDADLRPARPSGQAPMGPSSLAVNAQGTVYVADSLHRVIRVYSTQHHLVASWPIGIPGVAGMQLAVAVGGRGNVLVAIAAQLRCAVPYGPRYCATDYIVQRRSPAGALLGQFHSAIGRFGATNAIITQIAVAVDHQGDVYVATGGMEACYKDCRGFHFLVEHGSGGKVLRHWGTDELDVSANWPAIAIGGRGNLFLADDYNHRVEKRTSNGTIVARWSLGSIFPTPSRCSGTPQASGCVQPSGVAVDRKGSIYVSDPGSDRILKLSSNGKLLAQWGSGGSAADRFWFPSSLALDTRGRLWVDDVTNSRVQTLGTDGRFHVQFAIAHAGPGMALDRQGNVYIGQLMGRSVFVSKFSPTGTLLARWGGLHLAELPSGIAVAPNGDVFVVSFFIFQDLKQPNLDGVDILRLSPSGRQLGLIHVSNAETGSGIAVDAQENAYIAYGTKPHFEKWSRDGKLLESWGAPKPAFAFASPSPAGLALDSAGNLYVANTPQNVIDEFGPKGTLAATWGVPGSYAGQFHQPGGIAVDSRGKIYVADTGNQRIEKLAR